VLGTGHYNSRVVYRVVYCVRYLCWDSAIQYSRLLYCVVYCARYLCQESTLQYSRLLYRVVYCATGWTTILATPYFLYVPEWIKNNRVLNWPPSEMTRV
jgi:hypothetical protein